MQSLERCENYRDWLKSELETRIQKNPSYSLNAFAKSLEVSPASLSQIISGKRPLTKKTAIKIVEKSALPPEAAQAFIASALGVGTHDHAINSNSDESHGVYSEVEVDTFRLISEWYHFAILSLGDIKPNESSPDWISKRLGIPESVAKDAFDRLNRLGLVRRRGKGFYQSSKPLSHPAGKRNEVLKRAHLSVLQRAIRAISEENAPMEYCSAITMAVDESRLPEARQLIKNFRRKLCKLVESGKRERVYTLAVELFPISQK